MPGCARNLSQTPRAAQVESSGLFAVPVLAIELIQRVIVGYAALTKAPDSGHVSEIRPDAGQTVKQPLLRS